MIERDTMDERTGGARSVPLARGLSTKLVLLTALFVMIAEVLIFAPSIANFRLSWLKERLGTAAAVSVVLVEADPTSLSRPLQNEVLMAIGAKAIAVRDAGVSRLLVVAEMPPEVVEAARDPARQLKVGYCYATASADDAFLAVTVERDGVDAAMTGFSMRDGTWSRVVTGERRVARDEGGRVARVAFDGHDELGREVRAEGEVVARMASSGNALCWNGLVRWDLRGQECWGEDQDVRVGRAPQVRQASLRAEKGGPDVHVDQQVEATDRRVARPGQPDRSGVVHEDVDPAKSVDRRVDGAIDLLFVADVDLDREGAASGFFDLPSDGVDGAGQPGMGRDRLGRDHDVGARGGHRAVAGQGPQVT